MPDLTRSELRRCGVANELLPQSSNDTLGPYYPASFATSFAADLTPPAENVSSPGDWIRLSGVIRDMNGDPVSAAIVETWQADGGGRYAGAAAADRPGAFLGFSRQYVRDGRYCLRTIRPGSFLSGTSGRRLRAPNVTLTLFCDGITKLVTQIFFADEPLNAIDPLLRCMPEKLRPRLIAKRVASDDVTSYERDIVLRGQDETPFFDTAEC